VRAYAGIVNPGRVTFGVDESRRRLHRLISIERSLVHAASGWFIVAQNWETKQVLARHLWEDAEHMWSLFERASQLRGSKTALARAPTEHLSAALAEVVHAPSEACYLAGVYRVIKPALIQAYRQHLTETQALVDQPTIRVLRQILPEEEEHVAFVGENLDQLIASGDEAPSVSAWCTHLGDWLTFAGGILETVPARSEQPDTFANETFRLPAVPGRDARFTAVLNHKGSSAERERAGRLTWMMRVRLHEMAAAEVPASVLFESPDKPLAFYRDAARQIWDEVRHSMFGQAALEAEGASLNELHSFVGDYTWTIEQPPANRYVWLTIGLENKFMRYPPGKREEYEFCRDQARHPRMTLYQDYDWADEVVHAQMGRHWAPVLMGNKATLQDAQRLGDRLAAEFFEWLARQAEGVYGGTQTEPDPSE
jgi:hypothetical protein